MSEAWFNDQDIVTVERDLLERLKQTAAENASRKMRFCLHQDQNAQLHEMVIAVAPGAYLRPHRHPTKCESFHVIQGKFWLVIFDDSGKIQRKFVMGPRHEEDIFLYRIEKGYWHTIVPLTDFVILHEVTPGPFVREEASEFPVWAPAPEETEKIREFQKELIHRCEAC